MRLLTSFLRHHAIINIVLTSPFDYQHRFDITMQLLTSFWHHHAIISTVLTKIAYSLVVSMDQGIGCWSESFYVAVYSVV